MFPRSLRYHDAVFDDVADAITFYAAADPAVAKRFRGRLTNAFDAIAARPEMHARFDEGLFAVLVRGFPYFVLFSLPDDGPFVLAVAHARRQPGYWSDRLAD